jgi:hypothetical protein
MNFIKNNKNEKSQFCWKYSEIERAIEFAKLNDLDNLINEKWIDISDFETCLIKKPKKSFNIKIKSKL